MKELNLVEILRNCPKDMELDCIMYDNATFGGINYDNPTYPINVMIDNNFNIYLTKEGYHYLTVGAKCTIFPKGKNTWEGFVPPYQFKEGDILYVNTLCDNIIIFKEIRDGQLFKYVNFSCGIYLYRDEAQVCDLDEVKEIRIATEEEKEKLFDAIKSEGYKWNAEKKILEKIDKFDINTLEPFDRVLVRDSYDETWDIDFFSRIYMGKFETIHGSYSECVPYNEDTKHLKDTDDSAPEYYDTWE